MKKIFCLLSFFASVFAEAQVAFQKTYGGTGNDYSSSVQRTTDGGYVIVGNTLSFGAGDSDVYLLKTDSNGDTLWIRTYGGTNFERSISVHQTADGGFVLAGNTQSFGGNGDVYLLKTDGSGNLLWSKTFGGAANLEESVSVQQTTDGGYIITGYTYSFGAGGADVYLVKTDAGGNLSWSKTFGGINNDIGWTVRQTTDGGYVITGQTQSFGAGSYDVYLLKTDANGDTLWTRTFGGTGLDGGRYIQQTTDGGYVIIGFASSFGAGFSDVYLLKTDANGNLLWTKTFGGAIGDNGYSIQQTTDGGYIIAGETNSFGAGNYDVYLLKTDAGGNLSWTKTFGGVNGDASTSVQQTTDGGYMVAGGTNSFGAGNSDVFLIKTDSSGNSGCNESSPVDSTTSPATVTIFPATIVTSPSTIVNTPVTATGGGGLTSILCFSAVGIYEVEAGNAISVYPNPATTEVTINFGKAALYTVQLCNTLGEVLEQTQTNTATLTLNMSSYTKGIYFITLTDEVGNKVVRKVVKM